MLFMALDHTRDFFHAFSPKPTDLATTTPILFFTRWITHFCAPVFVFLAGISAYLYGVRRNRKALSFFLFTRGIWLVLAECLIVTLEQTFNPSYHYFNLQVIWAIGVSMIVLAVLIHLPLRVVAAFGLLMIALHNLLDRYHVQSWQGPQSPVPGFWTKVFFILHQAFEPFPVLWFFPSPIVFVLYPLIPWIGVMAAGYAFGALYQLSAARRRRLLLILGAAMTAGFLLIRALNHYGDPSHWARQSNWKFTAISFLNVTKYPPSLLFLLMTLGPALLALAWFESFELGPRASRPHSFGSSIQTFFVTFGRVPLFFYLLQWPTAHFISVIVHLIAGKPVRWMFGSQINSNGPPPGVGFNLAVVYACWIAGVLLLYPLCKWFAGVKARRRDWWLSYL